MARAWLLVMAVMSLLLLAVTATYGSSTADPAPGRKVGPRHALLSVTQTNNARCKKSTSYTVDEAQNKLGPNRCSTDCQCDGLRTCSRFGFCQGTSRPLSNKGCTKSTSYTVDEAKNKLGPNRCSTDCQCDGLRTCSRFGFCQGTSRPNTAPATNTGCQPGGKKSATYTIDEAKNKLGPNKCSTDCDCDGLRTCSKFGFCQGTSRPNTAPANNTSCQPGGKKTADYTIDEAKNKLGPNKCSTDCDCDGLRTCSAFGFCQGTSRPNTAPATNTGCQPGDKKTADYTIDEAKNKLGPNKCSTDCDCDGLRTCSRFGFCQGTSRP